MSLFSSLQLANNTLVATSLGLQVVGNNIANANTPGYLRQELNLVTAPSQRLGNLTIGLGVQVEGITQKIDQFLETRFRASISDLSNGETQESVYAELEAIVGELSDTDLSTSLSNFFNSVQDVLNQPESVSVRNIAVLKGKTLASDIQTLDSRVSVLHKQIDDQVVGSADEINSLLKKIAELNLQIVGTEGGSVSRSDAVGLRDSREVALKDLANLIDINAVEQPTGDVSVFANGEYLVTQASYREVKVAQKSVDGLIKSEIRIAETDSPIVLYSGKLAGLMTSRDKILGGYLENLDSFSRVVINEFNKAYSSGQGITGFSTVTSNEAVTDAAIPLDEAGLSFTPSSGSFAVQVLNRQTGQTTTTNIAIDLHGLDDDTTLSSLAEKLNAIDGISATVTDTRRLRINSDSANLAFSFANDTSGVLASLGINTFFTGTGASDMGVSTVVANDPAKFAASSGGINVDSQNAVKLAGLLHSGLSSKNGQSVAVLYDQMTSTVSQGSAVAKSVAEGYRTFKQALEGQHLAVSGVSLDEEAVRMISFQRTFQAAARLITTINEMLDTLVNL
jgi:flagellar hook-associated protein 1 FlgK